MSDRLFTSQLADEVLSALRYETKEKIYYMALRWVLS